MCRGSARGISWCVRAGVCAAVIGSGSATGEPVTRDREAPSLLLSIERAAAHVATPVPALRHVDGWARPALPSRHETRPRALTPLYVSFGALQALDAHSTLRAVRAGQSEANPFVAPFAQRPALMIGVKAAATAGTIAITEKLWRRHRVAAVTLMIAANVGYAAIVAHNYRQARR